MFEIAGGIILAVLILAVAPIVIGLVVEGIGIVGWILWKIGPWILAAIAVYVIVAAFFPISPWLGAGGLVVGVLIGSVLISILASHSLLQRFDFCL